MSTACLAPLERARKIETLILQSLATPGKQAALAVATGFSETKISRCKEHITAAALLIAHLGLKVVPGEAKCYKPEDIEPYLQLARKQVERVTSVDQLQWDDAA